jgi:hypothetical protein
MYNNLRGFAQNGMTAKFVDEMRLEAIRRKYYPHQVSRLYGAYLFDSREQVQTAIQRWNIKRKVHISQVNFSASKVTRVDSDWITNCLGNSSSPKKWMHDYWSAKPYGNSPLIETLCSGIGVVTNNLLRKEAYDQICSDTPLASKILSLSAAAFFCGHEDVGDCVPGLTLHTDMVHGSYYLDMRAFRGEMKIDFAACIRKCIEAGTSFPYAGECDQSEHLQLPAFNQTFELKLDNGGVAALNRAILD